MPDILAQFDGYTLRKVTDRDRPALEAWIREDHWHNGVYDAEYFMGLAADESGELAADPRATCYAIEDKRGVLFFIRLSRSTRVNIQFEPEATERTRRRVSLALFKGMAFLEVALARAGCEEWIFDTESRELAAMTKKHLGFVDSPNEMVRVMMRPENMKQKSGEAA